MARSSPPPLEVEVGREVARVAKELRAVDKKLPTKFRAELRKAGKSGADRVKSEVKSLPVKGVSGGTSAHPHKRRQLRRRVARGVRVRASTKQGMRIVTAMPEAEQSVIPRGLDSATRHRGGGWRHPVFGNRDVWVDQTGGSWFLEPLGEMQPDVQANVRRVLDDAAEQVAAAGGSQ
ncbi:hypothetical protein FHX37_0498 [Haloactinospora alba]|uniref:HK97 gp10 family phage protein n=1 Tax=Haloactinospora alba TaxID=405555 RepID=A0A543NFM6_9ACTN|nr:hypothetical protein [Haloactinospora alba]TQN30616.1 hypothetical protein FHX37_0498 [Haloactinospora alba]